MPKYRVCYETKIMQDKEDAEVVTAPGKGQAMLAAQVRIHPGERADEPYFHFEPLTIRLLEDGKYEVAYRTKVEEPAAGEIEVAAENAEKAAAKARFAVHKELIPPKCFKVISLKEIPDQK